MTTFKNISNLLIIGTIPPPLGGVTIHVDRLIKGLNSKKFIQYKFIDYKRIKFTRVLKNITKSRIVHMHVSNPLIRLFLVIYCKILLKKTILTFHGNLGRHNKFKNLLDKITIYLLDVPIVLNEESYQKAFKINSNSKLLSAFLPPNSKEEELSPEILKIISDFRLSYKYIITTNCSNYTIDNQGRDVYQIENLVNSVIKLPDTALIISDPKNVYGPKFEETLRKEGVNNIMFINKPHSFYALLSKVDYFIRYTTTDGDSISIHEALYQNIPVIATNVISRPKGVIVIGLDKLELDNILGKLSNPPQSNYIIEDNLQKLINIYLSLF